DGNRAGPAIVRRGVAEAMMRRRVDVVEPANRPDAIERREVEGTWPGAVLAAHPRAQIADEVVVIGDVAPALDRTHTALQIDRRADGGHGPDREVRGAG